jgi:hypothetical protein
MKLLKILAGIAAILLVGSALNAETVSYNATHNATTGGVDFYLNKFNTTLGTLTGVNVTIYSIQNSGNFTLTSNDPTGVNISAWSDSLYVTDSNGGTGLPYFSGTVAVGVSPMPQSIPGFGLQLFTITSTPYYANNVSVNITGNYTGYESVGGVGNATFNAKLFPSVSSTGGGLNTNYTNMTANSTLTITYTYSTGPVPVPEASTVIVQLLIVAGGDWMFVRGRRAAAVRA